MLGAYGSAMRTQFNGFGVSENVIADDEPMLSVYIEDDRLDQRATNVVKL